MYEIFNLIGSLFGYILWFCYQIVNNYGVAIILFTIIIRIIMFPISVNQQKSMAGRARLNRKQKELTDKYRNDKERLNEEINKLYQKEGVSPTSGCFTSLLPMLFVLSVYYSVVYPLSNTLHLVSDKVNYAINYVNSLPGMGISSAGVGRYEQIQFITQFNKLGSDIIDKLNLSASDIESINHFSSGFNFLGLDLLETPSDHGFLSAYILIPVLCFLTSVLSSLITMRIQNGGQPQQQQGCMMVMFLGLPLFSAWIAYTVPSAVGFYWICSTVISFALTLILNKFYNADLMTAKQEAQRIALRKITEEQQ